MTNQDRLGHWSLGFGHSEVSRPGFEPGPRPSEGLMHPLHHRDSESRRRDSHPHEPHYGCGAFLCRATPASAGVQGIEPCLAVLEAACSPGAHSYRSMCLAGIEPGTPRVTVSCANLY